MVERPIFVPAYDSPLLVREVSIPFSWNRGLAPIQKKKNIVALHAAAAERGYSPVLEVSTKSDDKMGRDLSAFNLKVRTTDFGEVPLEALFQGSKIFEGGGPYTDLYQAKDVRDAKRDLRLRESGALKGFRYEDFVFQLEPKTAFYDWLYVKALCEKKESLRTNVLRYAGFSDIEFNPKRSINCQARSCALLVTLIRNDWLDDAMSSPDAFLKLLLSREYRPDHRNEPQIPMFKVPKASLR